MEQVLITVFNSLNGSSGASFLISFTALILGGWLYFRKTNIDQVTSVGSLQQAQIKSLLEQIEFLSTELVEAKGSAPQSCAGRCADHCRDREV